MEFRVDYETNQAEDFPNWSFKLMTSEFIPEAKALIVRWQADSVPSFTPGIMNDLLSLGDSVRALYTAGLGDQLRYVVIGSSIPGMFNMGGDLGYFSDAIASQDRKVLFDYARWAIKIIHDVWMGFGHPVITFALVEGDALGGGFEAALAHNFLLAEKGVRLGLPEITFNLFPGMGGTTFLSRRLGSSEAEEILFHGRPYTAEEMFDRGVVDYLAERGQGTVKLLEILGNSETSTSIYRSLLKDRDDRQEQWQVTYDELRRVVDIWAEGCFGARDVDVRHMRRIVSTQVKKLAVDS